MDDASIERRVEEAFKGKTGTEFGLRYLELVQANWADLVKTMRRTVLLLALLLAAFFLFEHARSGEFAVGPLRTENLAALLTLIPAAVSYLLFELVDLTRTGGYYAQVARALIKRLYPSLPASGLDLLLWPGTTFALGLGAGFGVFPVGHRKTSQLNITMNLLTLTLLVGSIVVFLPYSLASLYGSEHTNAIAVTASAVFVFFNVARVALVVFDDFAEEQDKEDGNAQLRA